MAKDLINVFVSHYHKDDLLLIQYNDQKSFQAWLLPDVRLE